MSEAMRYKREIKANCSIDVKMLDTSEDGFILYIERSAVNPNAHKLLADFAEQKKLALQIDSGNFLISTNTLSPH
jgi:hypothetical protein